MKLARFDGDNLVFEISKREKRLLLDVLKLYPLIPSSHQKISQSGEGAAIKGMQKLLDEALAEQRLENKKQLQAMLDEEARFQAHETGYHFSLNPSQAEWLLQVLNDVRVGSWLILGEPDEKEGKTVELTAENARYLWAMELCGFFQSSLLQALSGRA